MEHENGCLKCDEAEMECEECHFLHPYTHIVKYKCVNCPDNVNENC